MRIWLVALAVVCNQASAKEIFPGLQTKRLDGIEVHFKAELQTKDVERSAKTDDSEETEFLLATYLDDKREQLYSIGFNPGPSDDPSFEIWPFGKRDQMVSMSGLSLYLPGNGSVYVSGHTNNMFDMRRKFERVNGQWQETKQPFYFVGKESKTLKAITLYGELGLKTEVAKLPPGAAITVLINQDDYFLLKTPFGLTGWMKLEEYSQLAETLEGIYFAGD
jgi:hypothetical protein